MGIRERLSGNEAVSYAIKQINPDVMPAFPITPSTEIPQFISTYISNGEIDTEFIPVESEHSAMSAAIGASAAIVPMEVPIETEIKHPIRNRPATAKCAGINDNPKLTVLSTPPAAVTAPEKPPAQRKIRLIVMMFSSPTPLAITSIFLLKLNSLFCKNATNNAIKNATIAGIA